MKLKPNKIWNYFNKNFILKESQIWLNSSINIKIINKNFNKSNNFVKKLFILSKTQIIYLKDNKYYKYINLDTVKINFDDNNLIVIIYKHECLFKFYFNDIKNYNNWKVNLKKYGILTYFNNSYKLLNSINKNKNLYEGYKISNNKKYWIKVIIKDDVGEEIIISKILRNHPNIINLIEIYDDNNYYYLIFEYHEFISWKYLLDSNSDINKNKLIYNILNGLEYLHINQIKFNGLSIDDILLYKDNTNNLIPVITNMSILFQFENKIKIISKNRFSYRFVAPEINNYKNHHKIDNRIDSYTVGCIIYFIYFNKSIFKYKSNSDLIYLNKFNLFSFDSEFYIMPLKLKNLIKNCLAENFIDRISLNEIIQYYEDLLYKRSFIN